MGVEGRICECCGFGRDSRMSDLARVEICCINVVSEVVKIMKIRFDIAGIVRIKFRELRDGVGFIYLFIFYYYFFRMSNYHTPNLCNFYFILYPQA